MSDNQKFVDFGHQLKKIRLDASKTINDVSGAVELPIEKIKQLEMGSIRPQQELIFLLAGYFKLPPPKIKHLLDLAGYNKKRDLEIQEYWWSLFNSNPKKVSSPQPVVLALVESVPNDRAIYIDNTHINVSSSGLIVEFTQKSTANQNQGPKIISKIGMSVEQARKLRDNLEQALAKLKFKSD